jgi:glutathione S-transferase
MDKVQFVSVDVPNGEHRKPEFLAKNPSDAVPALELDDGTVIIECSAITEYIGHVFPGPSLRGTTPVQRAKMHVMQRRGESCQTLLAWRRKIAQRSSVAGCG